MAATEALPLLAGTGRPPGRQRRGSVFRLCVFFAFATGCGMCPYVYQSILPLEIADPLAAAGRRLRRLDFVPPLLNACVSTATLTLCALAAFFLRGRGAARLASGAAILAGARLGGFGGVSDSFEVVALLYIDGVFRTIMMQLKLLCICALRHLFLGKRQPRVVWLTVACTCLAVVVYASRELFLPVPAAGGSDGVATAGGALAAFGDGVAAAAGAPAVAAAAAAGGAVLDGGFAGPSPNFLGDAVAPPAPPAIGWAVSLSELKGLFYCFLVMCAGTLSSVMGESVLAKFKSEGSAAAGDGEAGGGGAGRAGGGAYDAAGGGGAGGAAAGGVGGSGASARDAVRPGCSPAYSEPLATAPDGPDSLAARDVEVPTAAEDAAPLLGGAARALPPGDAESGEVCADEVGGAAAGGGGKTVIAVVDGDAAAFGGDAASAAAAARIRGRAGDFFINVFHVRFSAGVVLWAAAIGYAAYHGSLSSLLTLRGLRTRWVWGVVIPFFVARDLLYVAVLMYLDASFIALGNAAGLLLAFAVQAAISRGADVHPISALLVLLIALLVALYSSLVRMLKRLPKA